MVYIKYTLHVFRGYSSLHTFIIKTNLFIKMVTLLIIYIFILMISEILI